MMEREVKLESPPPPPKTPPSFRFSPFTLRRSRPSALLKSLCLGVVFLVGSGCSQPNGFTCGATVPWAVAPPAPPMGHKAHSQRTTKSFKEGKAEVFWLSCDMSHEEKGRRASL